MLPRMICALIAATLALSACGGDDNEDSGEAAAPAAPAAWVQEANEACTTSQEQVTALAPEVAKEESDPARAAALVIERSVPIQEAMFADLAQVQPPDDIKDDYDEWRGQLESSLDLFPRLVKALRQGKEDPELTQEANDLAEAVQPFADEHGLTPCVAGATPQAG